MLSTVVVNVKKSSCDELIDRTTIFGNPFQQWKFGRAEAIRRFEQYFWSRIERDPDWKAKVLKLKGKVLGCHCKPLGCHGDVYCDFLNAYDQVEEFCRKETQ